MTILSIQLDTQVDFIVIEWKFIIRMLVFIDFFNLRDQWSYLYECSYKEKQSKHKANCVFWNVIL